jgi:large subunit ribosomal protein L33
MVRMGSGVQISSTAPFTINLISVNIYNLMAKSDKRKIIGMVSEETGHRTYYTKKNTMNTPDKLQLKKYDPIARKHVLYVETKKNLGRNEVKPRKK